MNFGENLYDREKNKSTNTKMGACRRKRFGGGSLHKKILDNLRDGLPHPYTEQDGRDYISAMIAADLRLRLMEK